MDIASLLGLVGCMVLVLIGVMKDDPSAINNFLDPTSALITFGGSLFCVMTMTNSIGDFFAKIRSFLLVIKMRQTNESEMIQKIIELSNIARKEGLLALEEAAGDVDDEFLKKGILLIVDGTDPELVRDILEIEMVCVNDRHKDVIGFWENMAAMGPAWGMIGTLIGLINMLKNLSDFASIGPNMSVALITTLYGSILANWICTPIANKLKKIDANETMQKEVMIEGLLSIQAGENPRVIEEKLKSFLSPSVRKSSNDMEDEGGEE
ncbi:MAG: motility protein A [Lachnospiraceae bacterium]|nr:motility protein A [Lachnospiraceae bacterium]